MKNTTRMLSLLLAFLMTLGLLAGCGGSREDDEDEETAKAAQTDDAADEKTEAENDKEEDKGDDAGEGEDADEVLTPMIRRVTDQNGNVLYLFGTIHVGDSRSKEVFKLIEGYFSECDSLAVEFDVNAFAKDTQAIRKYLEAYLLTDGTKISDHISGELYEKAVELLKEAKSYSKAYDMYNTAFWGQLVDTAVIKVYTGLDADLAMDSILLKKADKLGKNILEVESAEFQLGILNGFPERLYILQLEELLSDPETTGKDTEMLYEYWLAGDEEGLMYLDDDEEEFEENGYTDEDIALVEEYNRVLLDDRNEGMADKAEEYLASGEKVFFAVGAAHMAGENGVAALLEQRGYNVEILSWD